MTGTRVHAPARMSPRGVSTPSALRSSAGLARASDGANLAPFAAARSAASGAARRQLKSSTAQPRAAAASALAFATTAGAAKSSSGRAPGAIQPWWPPGLSSAAAEKRPAARGSTSRCATDAPPADTPKTMTRAGSPPKAAQLSRTHASARSWSPRPRLSPPKNPRTPRRYCGANKTEPVSRVRFAALRVAAPLTKPPPWT